MSILSSLYHGEIHNKPNDVHNVPETGHSGGGTDGSGNSASGGAFRNTQGGAGLSSGAARNMQGGTGYRSGGWMDVSFADESAMDAQLADAHAVALSDAFDRADAAPHRMQDRTGTSAPQKRTEGNAPSWHTQENAGGSAPSRRTQKSTDGSATTQRAQNSTDGSAVLPRHAERRMEALKEGDLRPPLYYTGQEQTPCANGVWESPHTVASKLESKEEFPQG